MTDTQYKTAGSRPMPLAIGLGLLALVPFVAGVIDVTLTDWLDPGVVLKLALAYLATIVSFIGGVQWGRMLATERVPALDMVAGVTPALIAWPAVVLGGAWAFALLLGALVFAWGVDERGYQKGWQSAGFLQLRRLLSVVVTACMIVIGWQVLRG